MFHQLIDSIQNLIDYYPEVVFMIIFILGATVGSFLNVVIYRTPIMIEFEYAEMIKANSDTVYQNVEDAYTKGNGMTLSLPRSRCSCCGKTIPWYHNIPIISYFVLRGKCFNCKEIYSSRYVIIEIINMMAWVSLFYFFGATLTFAMLAILFSLLLSMSMIDFDHKILPDNLVFITACLGLLYSTTETSLITPTEAIYHSIIAFSIAHVFISVYSKIRGKLMMGFGDIKLIGALTPFIGIYLLNQAILIACVSGILYYIGLMILKKRDEDRTFAFGPFICLGFYGTLIYQLIH